MSTLFAERDVNTGRQLEFDYSKGIFLFLILFVHAFQIAGAGAGAVTAAYRAVYMAASMTGASIFIFVMGLGSRYSRAGVSDMVRSGLKLFAYQYLNNIGYAASILLPYAVFRLVGNASVEDQMPLVKLYLTYLNIFSLAGGIYLVLALLRKLHAPVWLHVALGLVINLFSPKLVGLETGVLGVDYLLGYLFGGPRYASFSLLNYLPYALLGVGFGAALRRAADKRSFYRFACILSGAVLALFCAWLLIRHPSFELAYDYIRRTYTKPDFLRTLANTASVILLAGALYFATGAIQRREALNRNLLYYSKHISKYYAVHPLVCYLVFGAFAFKPFGFWGCVALFLFEIAATDVVVRLYNRLRKS